MKPSEVIDIALTEVMPDESMWCQHMLEGANGRHCMAGALMVAADGNVNYMLATDWPNSPYYPARLACMEVIGELGLNISIPLFNDSSSYNEVRAVMEKARAGLQEQGQ